MSTRECKVILRRLRPRADINIGIIPVQSFTPVPWSEPRERPIFLLDGDAIRRAIADLKQAK